MPVLLYALEKLSDHSYHDCRGNDIAPFSDPEAICSDSLHGYWSGTNTVEREIRESFSEGNQRTHICLTTTSSGRDARAKIV